MTFEHLAGELNTGADGLSQLAMTDNVPTRLLQEIYSINKLSHNDNFECPLAMSLIQSKQAKDEYLQSKLKK